MIFKNCTSAISALMLVACASAPDIDYTRARPSTPPVRATTNFDSALKCMDELLLRSNVGGNIGLTTRPFADPSASVAAATDDMVASAALKMSTTSSFFKVWNITIPLALNQNQVVNQTLGNIEVQGSITAYDRAVSGDAFGGGISVAGAGDIGGRVQSQTSIITVTLKFVNSATGFVEPGTLATSSMLVKTSSKGLDLTGQIETVGGFLEISFERSEGLHQAVNALIDLAMIEAVGNYAKIPYQTCLSTIGTDPATVNFARKDFDKLSEEERRIRIAQALVQQGYMTAYNDTGTLGPSLRAAIADYQVDNSLPALGLPTFEVFYELFKGNYGAAPAAPIQRISNRLALNVTPVETPITPVFQNGARYNLVARRERLKFAISTAEAAYLICYYTDAFGRTTMIYPSPEKANQRVSADQIVYLPGPSDQFSIQAGLELPGTPTDWGNVLSAPPFGYAETVLCFADRKPIIARIPDEVAKTYLNASPIGSGPDDVIDYMQSVIGPNIEHFKYTYYVRPSN